MNEKTGTWMDRTNHQQGPWSGKNKAARQQPQHTNSTSIYGPGTCFRMFVARKDREGGPDRSTQDGTKEVIVRGVYTSQKRGREREREIVERTPNTPQRKIPGDKKGDLALRLA